MLFMFGICNSNFVNGVAKNWLMFHIIQMKWPMLLNVIFVHLPLVCGPLCN